MMQFNDYYAWMDSERNVTVLRPNQPPLAGIYHKDTGKTQYLSEAPNEAATQKALSHALLPLKLYRERAYGLPPTDTKR